MHRWIAVVLAVLTLLPTPVVRAAAPTIKGDPQAVAELQAVFQRFLAARSWRTRMRSGDTTTTTEFVAPDRFHLIIAHGTRDSTEMFIIGRQVWLRSSEGCNKLPAAMPFNFANPREMTEHGAADTTITVTRGGSEAVDGTPTRTYLLVVETKGVTVREKMYVATATGFPRRLEIQTERGPLILDYFDFNAPIAINDPPC